MHGDLLLNLTFSILGFLSGVGLTAIYYRGKARRRG